MITEPETRWIPPFCPVCNADAAILSRDRLEPGVERYTCRNGHDWVIMERHRMITEAVLTTEQRYPFSGPPLGRSVTHREDGSIVIRIEYGDGLWTEKTYPPGYRSPELDQVKEFRNGDSFGCVTESSMMLS